MSVEIGFGIPSGQEVKVAKILYAALGQKFTQIFGPARICVPIISKYMRNDRTVVALENGVVVGFAGLAYELFWKNEKENLLFHSSRVCARI